MKLDEIMKLSSREIEKMSRKELARAVSDLRSVARKRIERLERDEVYSPAYQSIMQSGGIPTVKGMDVIALRNEFKRYKKFIGLKTSTVRGAKKYKEKTLDNFEKIIGRHTDLTDEQKEELLQYLDTLRDSGDVTKHNYRETLLYMVEEKERAPQTGDEIMAQVRKEIQRNYETSTRGFYASDRF